MAALQEIFGFTSREQLQGSLRQWVSEALQTGSLQRDSIWTESLGVGCSAFVERLKEALGEKARYRGVQTDGERLTLREDFVPYSARLEAEK